MLPFPKGFRMLAGEPDRKSPNPIYVYECHRNPDLSGSIVSSHNSRQNRKPRPVAFSLEGISTLTIHANTGTSLVCRRLSLNSPFADSIKFDLTFPSWCVSRCP